MPASPWSRRWRPGPTSARTACAFLVLYVLAGAALLYSAYTTVAVLLACYLWVLVQWRSQRDPVGRVALWTAAQLGAPLLFLPWAATLGTVVQRNAASAPALSLVELARRVGCLGYGFSVGETLSPINPAALVGIVLTLVLGTIALVQGRRETALWLPLLLVTAVWSLSIAITMLTTHPQNAFQALPHQAEMIKQRIRDAAEQHGIEIDEGNS